MKVKIIILIKRKLIFQLTISQLFLKSIHQLHLVDLHSLNETSQLIQLHDDILNDLYQKTILMLQ